MRTGILGGTFDPIHLGHLALADAALTCGNLDRVVLVPSAQPPHKGAPQASAADRLEMCRLAAAEHDRIEVSDVELRREGPSYTVDTLAFWQEARPQDELWLVLGWDAAREMRSWHRFQDVRRQARLLLLSRPTLPSPLQADLVQAGLDPQRVTFCTETTPDIRATDIRALAAERASLVGLVPPPVDEYIRNHRLYSAAGGALG